MTRIPYLDGWRGCAILAVLAAHFGSVQFINLGRFGVELFFVLSGRLMAEILFVRNTPLSSFFPRRFTRVYPALFVLATIMLAIGMARGMDITVPQYVAAITFVANYSQFWIGRSLLLDHVWSLCIEEHMYIALGLIALVHRRWKLPLIPLFAAMISLSIIIGIVQTIDGLGYRDVYWRTDVRGASLLMGAVAYLADHEGKLSRLSAAWLPITFGAAALIFSTNIMPDPVKYSLGSACVAMALITMSHAPKAVLGILQNPLLLRAGLWSFSLYLWQQPYYALGGGIPARALHLTLAVLSAAVSFYLVEQPARRYLNRLMETRRAPVFG